MKNRNSEFLLILLGLFVSGMLLMAFLGAPISSDMGDSEFMIGMLSGGFILSSCFCGGYIFARFIRNKHMLVKIVCAIVAPLTIVVVILVGHILLIPVVVIKLASLFTVKKDNNLNKET